MAQVIVYTQEDRIVAICRGTGVIPIEEVLVRDCPPGAIIIDDSTLPTEREFRDAWRLNGTTVEVDFTAAVDLQNKKLNIISRIEAQHRMTNTYSGITNKLSDVDWLALLSTTRSNISSSTNLQQLKDCIVPVETAISENA